MKNTIKLLGIIVITAVIGFSFASCKGADAADPTEAKYVSTDGTNTYELVISAPRAAYSPKNGDTYDLTINPENKTSSGKVATVSGGSFTLTPVVNGTDGTQFIITVSGTGITDITGNIILTDGTPVTPPAAGTLKPGTGGDNNNNGGSISGSTIVSGATVIYDSGIKDLAEAKRITDFSDGLNEYLDGESSVTISGGKVTIKLGIPKAEFLPWWIDWLLDGLSLNPSNAKVVGLIDFYPTDFNYYLYYLACVKDENNEAALIYADKDVKITGTQTEYDDYNVKWTKIWNVSLKKGWNYLIWSVNRTTNTATATYTSSTTMPKGFNWTVF